jgi:tetratricopeptide (TPR) repeat protein
MAAFRVPTNVAPPASGRILCHTLPGSTNLFFGQLGWLSEPAQPRPKAGKLATFTGQSRRAESSITEPSMPTREEIYDEADRLKDAGKLDEAVAKLQEALQVDPTYALAHSALAVVYGRLGKHDEAIRHGLKVCELEPTDPFSYTAMSVTYVRAGKIQEAEDAKARAAMLQGR